MAPILIQGAMDVETNRLAEGLSHRTEGTLGGFPFWRGRYGGWELAVIRSGVGSVYAAAAAALGIEAWRPALVVSQGTAGAHRADLRVGDIVVGRTCVDLQSAVTPRLETGGGMAPEKWVLWDFDADTPATVYDGDPVWAARFEAGPYGEGRVCAGRLGGGDVFNRERDRILWLRRQVGTDCEDMESAAVYRVCRRLGVPCLGLRIISNNELTGAPYRREVGEALQDFLLGTLTAGEEAVPGP